MARSAGTHEGYQTEARPPERMRRLGWYPLRSYQPWPLDWVEPVAWRTMEEW
jgi:hypothetical protein